MKPKVIMIASSKGGVGKSTVALGVSRHLVKRGHCVLLCDLDFGNACLDILLGAEDRVIYTVADAADEVCKPSDAIIKDTAINGLHFLPAPAGGKITAGAGADEKKCEASAVVKSILSAAEDISADYIIIDTGAGISELVTEAARISDTVIIVSTHTPLSLRASQSTAARMQELGKNDVRLVVNAFEPESTLRKRNMRKGLLDIIDLSKAPLAGVVPYDYSLLLNHEGAAIVSEVSDKAFNNIAKRLDGEDAPLFEGIKKIRKIRKKLYK